MKCWKMLALAASAAFLFVGCGGSSSGTGAPGTVTSSIADSSARTCGACHDAEYTTWTGSGHSDSQQNGPELAEGAVGLSPTAVIGDEDCITCHSPTAVLANGGMDEAGALGYFYLTAAAAGTASDGTPYGAGTFFPGTVPINSSEWPNISCLTCHDPGQTMTPGGSNPVILSLFDSHYVDTTTGIQGVRKPVNLPSELCGQCHGSLQTGNQGTDDTFSGGPFSEWQMWAAATTATVGNWTGTDHMLFDGWKLSRHSKTQSDPAGELADERVGETPAAVTADENCIACHGPTAVEANGGMTEAEALSYFFSTSGGVFGASTAAIHTTEWPNVDCAACHDPHDPGVLSYFNSATKKRVPMSSAEELCGQCHGSLRFPDTDHRSYDILQGTGGVGVPDYQTMYGAATCTDCHMYVDSITYPDEDAFNEARTHGHTWQVIVNGGDPAANSLWGWSLGALAGDFADHGAGTGNGDAPHVASCTKCHPSMDAQAQIDQFKADFSALNAIATQNVDNAATAMASNTDPVLLAKLDEAQFNLNYANEDESGGFHNHYYLMSLLNDANDRALEILNP